MAERGLDASPTSEVLLEESVLGWKEYEMEVVRDRRDSDGVAGMDAHRIDILD